MLSRNEWNKYLTRQLHHKMTKKDGHTVTTSNAPILRSPLTSALSECNSARCFPSSFCDANSENDRFSMSWIRSFSTLSRFSIIVYVRRNLDSSVVSLPWIISETTLTCMNYYTILYCTAQHTTALQRTAALRCTALLISHNSNFLWWSPAIQVIQVLL